MGAIGEPMPGGDDMGMSDAEDGLPGHLQASKVPPSIVSKRRGDLIQQDLIWHIFAALFLHI
jgi:hypothetical protein